ncbi:MAG: alpha/beta hydrolase [Verrucomicrobia bacterium]|nr:alpha/beta hydrolase [Verrucomicrobiota bacterium]MDA1068206.1 alpha/beta hydrolase [Verrucomicrobiota bacterium]
MNLPRFVLLSIFTAANLSAADSLYFREDWKEIPFALPITPAHVNNPDLRMETHGPGRLGIKKSHHEEKENDPFYIWSGQCKMSWALSLRKQAKLVDLSSNTAKVSWRSRQSGGRQLYLLIKLPGERWFVSEQFDKGEDEWHDHSFKIKDLSWRHFSIIKCVAEEKVKAPDLREIEQIGFTDQVAGNGSKFSSRLDWIEVYGKEKAAPRVPQPAVKSSPVKKELPAGVEAHGNLVYASYGDRELTLDLYQPKGPQGPLPAIIFIHGGGFYKGDPSSYTAMAIELAEDGYVTMNMFYRLSGEAPFPAAIQDCKAAVRWARANARKYNIDPNRIGSVGGSAGGHLSGLLGTSGPATYLEGLVGHEHQSSQIQACVVMAGGMDWRTEEAQATAAEDPRRRIQTFLNGTYKTATQTYHNASPVFHVSKATAPMCFMDGEFDLPGTRYPEIISELNSRGIYNESHVIEKAPHAFWSSHPFFEPATEILIKFFDRTLRKR